MSIFIKFNSVCCPFHQSGQMDQTERGTHKQKKKIGKITKLNSFLKWKGEEKKIQTAIFIRITSFVQFTSLNTHF